MNLHKEFGLTKPKFPVPMFLGPSSCTRLPVIQSKQSLNKEFTKHQRTTTGEPCPNRKPSLVLTDQKL